MTKLSGKPPSLKPEEFIKGAKDQPAPAKPATTAPPEPETPEPEILYPWQAPEVRDDVIKNINLRLPEAYRLKLNYIAENTPDSAQRFIRNSLLPAIDEKIGQLIK